MRRQTWTDWTELPTKGSEKSFCVARGAEFALAVIRMCRKSVTGEIDKFDAGILLRNIEIAEEHLVDIQKIFDVPFADMKRGT